MEDNTRYGRISNTRKEVVGCVQDVVEKKKFPVQFEYGKKKYMSASLLSYICLKDNVDKEVD